MIHVLTPCGWIPEEEARAVLDLAGENKRLLDENKRLRELVRRAWHETNAEVGSWHRRDDIRTEMLELGIDTTFDWEE